MHTNEDKTVANHQNNYTIHIRKNLPRKVIKSVILTNSTSITRKTPSSFLQNNIYCNIHQVRIMVLKYCKKNKCITQKTKKRKIRYSIFQKCIILKPKGSCESSFHKIAIKPEKKEKNSYGLDQPFSDHVTLLALFASVCITD